jgi:hypothetical protein
VDDEQSVGAQTNNKAKTNGKAGGKSKILGSTTSNTTQDKDTTSSATQNKDAKDKKRIMNKQQKEIDSRQRELSDIIQRAGTSQARCIQLEYQNKDLRTALHRNIIEGQRVTDGHLSGRRDHDESPPLPST